MIAVFKRELKSYLSSPVGYSYLFIFLLVTGFFFWVNNIVANSTDTIGYFAYTRYLLIVILPLLAMKLFPEERKNKTDQILITAPISITQMVMGKFLAAYTMFVIGLIPTLINMIFLASVGYCGWKLYRSAVYCRSVSGNCDAYVGAHRKYDYSLYYGCVFTCSVRCCRPCCSVTEYNHSQQDCKRSIRYQPI